MSELQSLKAETDSLKDKMKKYPKLLDNQILNRFSQEIEARQKCKVHISSIKQDTVRQISVLVRKQIEFVAQGDR